jgi:hypothetical protein
VEPLVWFVASPGALRDAVPVEGCLLAMLENVPDLTSTR